MERDKNPNLFKQFKIKPRKQLYKEKPRVPAKPGAKVIHLPPSLDN